MRRWVVVVVKEEDRVSVNESRYEGKELFQYSYTTREIALNRL